MAVNQLAIATLADGFKLEAGGDTLVLVSTIVNVKDIVRAYNDALPNDRDVNRLLQSPPPNAPPGGQGTGVSLATLSASHLTPWRGKLICARASSPTPSSVCTVPSPNLA